MLFLCFDLFVRHRSISGMYSFASHLYMKRLTPVIPREAAEAKWPGLQLQPMSSGDRDRSERGAALSRSLVNHVTCITGQQVEVRAAMSCQMPISLGMLWGSSLSRTLPPVDTGRESDASRQVVRQEVQEESEGSADEAVVRNPLASCQNYTVKTTCKPS